MAHLREYYYNDGDMLALAKFQHEEQKKAVGMESDILSAAEVIRTELMQRSNQEKVYGKYHDLMTHTWSSQTRTRYSLYINHWF